MAKKSRVLHTHFAQSANFSRDFPSTSLSLLEKISEGREAKRGRKYLRALILTEGMIMSKGLEINWGGEYLRVCRITEEEKIFER